MTSELKPIRLAILKVSSCHINLRGQKRVALAYPSRNEYREMDQFGGSQTPLDSFEGPYWRGVHPAIQHQPGYAIRERRKRRRFHAKFRELG